MGWSHGVHEGRDIGYGVPAICDHPACDTRIDRGLAYVCGGEPYGGERGCGLFFCYEHLHYANRLPMQLCRACLPRRHKMFTPKPDVREWIEWKLKDTSWATWRKENPKDVARLRAALPTAVVHGEA